jgi:hypothetical protein
VLSSSESGALLWMEENRSKLAEWRLDVAVLGERVSVQVVYQGGAGMHHFGVGILFRWQQVPSLRIKAWKDSRCDYKKVVYWLTI